MTPPHPASAGSTAAPPWPLSLADQLDAMLLGWLEHRADRRPTHEDGEATAVITVSEAFADEVEALCARWDLELRRSAPRAGRWTVLRVSGRMLPVLGLTDVIALLRGAG